MDLSRASSLGRRQHGQSLVETLVALLLLIPVAVAVMLMGQYIHIQQMTQSASREAAWAAASDPALLRGGLPAQSREQTHLRAREFAATGAVIKSNDRAPDRYVDPLLTTFAGRSLLETNDLRLRVYNQGAAPSVIDKALAPLGAVLGTAGLNKSLPPNRKGLVTAEVVAQSQPLLGTNGQVLNFMGPTAAERFQFSAKTVLLVDAWDAAGGGENVHGERGKSVYYDRSVRGVISPLVPTTWFSGLGIDSLVHVLGDLPLISNVLTPGWDHFELGRNAPDVVPSDKLTPYRNAR